MIFGFGGLLEGSAFCSCFLAGLGWAGLGCRWAAAGLFSRNRNCIGFGSGVLRGFAGFCNLIFGFGGRLAGSAFCLCFWLGWTGLPLGCFRARLGNVRNYGRGSSIRSEIQAISIYPALEGLGFRVYRNCIGFGSGVLGGFARFWRFLLLLLGSGGGLVFGWAGLGGFFCFGI